MRKVVLIVVLFIFGLANLPADAQCAMCRTTLENNVSQGNPGIAAGINFGILYLLATPYLAIGLIAFFWFRASKRNKSRLDESALAG
jgi:hypothetical protein